MLGLFSVMLVVGMFGAGLEPADVRIQGRVVDQSGLPLPGVSLQLAPAQDAAAQAVATTARTAVTDSDGTFSFDVAAGHYRLDAELDGFLPVSSVLQASTSLNLPDIVLTIRHFSEETTVTAAMTTELQARQFGAPSTLSDSAIEHAPLRSSRYDDMLPLLPNVVRGPDGLVSVAGARAPNGVVLLNGVPASDVASGNPVASIPLGAIDSVQVIGTGYPVEYGASTGGVTVINTRAGTDAYRFSVNSFTPRFRLTDGGVHGIEAWEPKISLRGPLAKGRVWFAQAFDYHFEKTRADTVAGSQDRRAHGFTSFTQVDARTAPGHVLSAWVNGQQEHVDGERLGAFTPLGTVPTLERASWSAAAIDRAAFGTSTFETRLAVRHQDTSLLPDGDGAYLIGHDVTRGAYFDTATNHALAVGAEGVLARLSTGRFGHHVYKLGASASHRLIDGHQQGQPVTYLRSSLVPARIVNFIGPGVYAAESTQVGIFAQDSANLGNHLTLDAGVRLDYDSQAGTFAAPRAGITWAADGDTTVSAGAGWFAGDMPLVALAFHGFQSREITTFDASGMPVGSPVTYRNELSGDLGRSRALLWSARVDRRLGANWKLRTAVQARRGINEPTVSPTDVAGSTLALLATAGTSRTHSFEATLGYHQTRRQHQLYVSYVRASSTGNTNDVGQLEGLFRSPRLDAPELAPLPADVPHRLLAWGVFSLPAQTTIAPFLEVRTGFPYSAVYDDWSYAGPRFSQRYPLFVSLDLVVNKTVTLPGGLKARVGVKLYNVAGKRNGRDVQACVDRPDFGRTYNALGRQVRGVFEIIWSGNTK